MKKILLIHLTSLLSLTSFSQSNIILLKSGKTILSSDLKIDSGRLCMLKYPKSKNLVLDLKHFSQGVYTLEIITEKEIFNKKIIIK